MAPVDAVLPGVPRFESPFFEKTLATEGFSPRAERLAREFRENGVLVVDFEDPEFETVASAVIRDLQGRHAGPHGKVLDAWRDHAGVRRIAMNARIRKLVEMLYGRRAIPFQTLNFCRGTEQHIHSDAIHFHCAPERFMCGAWVAFEDIDLDNGPLVYYPGSHRLPVYGYLELGQTATDQQRPYEFYARFEKLFSALVEAHDLKPALLPVRKGQVVLWAANLIHGGSQQRDRDRTRHSQVTHYYFEDCVYYTPLASDPFLGHVRFKDVVDISTGKRVAHRYNGRAIEPWAATTLGRATAHVRSSLHRLLTGAWSPRSGARSS
jgi:hypothetical protein